MVWILSEADAFKKKFAGMVVHDSTAPEGGRTVDVKYRTPQEELSNTEYPSVILDIESVLKDPTREHRGYIQLGYIPENVYDPDVPLLTRDRATGEMVPYDPDTMPTTSSPIFVDAPIPYNINFSVTVYTRNRTHLYEIASELVKVGRIPDRFGFLQVPERGTVQSLFLTGGPEFSNGKDENDKVFHTAYYEVQVATELLAYEVSLAKNYVSEVHLDIDTIPDPMDGDPDWNPVTSVGFGNGPFGQTPFGS